MHLQSASVDLEGNLIVTGSLTFPPDDDGKFIFADSVQLRISRPGYSIVRCTAERDRSGFQKADHFGARLSLPSAFNMIEHAIRFGTAKPVEASVKSQAGSLSIPVSPTADLRQPLSDWHLRIEEIDGGVRVALSAALHATDLNPVFRSEQNFWGGQPGSRIAVEFTVNNATRTACYGALFKNRAAEGDGTPAAPEFSDASDLNIERAPVGPVAQFAICDGRWISFGDHDGLYPSIALTEHSHVTRLPNGFLSHGNYVWPRTWLRGVDFLALAKVLGGGPVRVSGSSIIGSRSNDGREGWSESSSETAVELSLGKEGLSLDYFLKIKDRPVHGRTTLPWELLILRYPALAKKRKQILALGGNAALAAPTHAH